MNDILARQLRELRLKAQCRKWSAMKLAVETTIVLERAFCGHNYVGGVCEKCDKPESEL